MADIKNILQEEDALNEKQMMQYLHGNLPEDELHAIEKQMADSDFINDGIEGLQKFKKPQQIDEYVTQLNHQLQKQTGLKKRRKEKRRLKTDEWITITIIVVLLISMLGYFVISKLRNGHLVPVEQTR